MEMLAQVLAQVTRRSLCHIRTFQRYVVAAVMATAFPKAKALPEGQHAASQPVTGESFNKLMLHVSLSVQCRSVSGVMAS